MHNRVDMLPAARIKRILDEATGQDLSSKEKFEFLPSIKDRSFLSDGQEKWLRGIETRIFNESEDE
jgi:hypothetical protein